MKAFKVSFLFFFIAIVARNVHAFDFKLANDTMVLGQSQQAVAFISNTSKVPIAIEVYPAARSYTPEGEEKLAEAFDQLIVFPSQVILGPNEQQAIAIRWVGPVVLEREKPFRLVAENVPIEISTANFGDKSKKAGQLRMTFRIVKSFYVQPPEVISQIELLSQKLETDKSGESFLVLTLVNSGTGHRIVDSGTFSVVFSDPKVSTRFVTVSVEFGSDIKRGINLLPGEQRNVKIKFSKKWNVPQGYVPTSAQIKSVIYAPAN